MNYKIAIHRTEEGISVSVPALPGCWSEGDTEEEALANTWGVRDTKVGGNPDTPRRSRQPPSTRKDDFEAAEFSRTRVLGLFPRRQYRSASHIPSNSLDDISNSLH